MELTAATEEALDDERDAKVRQGRKSWCSSPPAHTRALLHIVFWCVIFSVHQLLIIVSSALVNSCLFRTPAYVKKKFYFNGHF